MIPRSSSALPILAAFLAAANAGAQAIEAPPTPPPPPVIAEKAPVADVNKVDIALPALTLTLSPHPRVEFRNWFFEMYGFAELDMIHDSTQGMNDLAGNALVARPGTVSGDHGQTQFGVRNSRLGMRLGGPEMHGIKASGIFEMDLLGNDPAIQQTGSVNGANPIAGGVTEAAYFNNPSPRVRHAALMIETPFVDVLAGQYWALFGWQSGYDPSSVEIQGLPGEVFGRTAQLRVSHTFRSRVVIVDVAAAMLRPPERASEAPDGQAGVKVSFPMWKGIRTAGSVVTGIDAASIGVSGVLRKFSVPDPSGASNPWLSTNGKGISVDTFIPIIPATYGARGNGLSFMGSYVNGVGTSDLYTGLTGGLNLQQSNEAGSLKPCPAVSPATTCYSAPIDNGMVAINSNGHLEAIQWQSFIVGLQYFLPGGFLWVSGNYSQMNSNNSHDLAGTASAKTSANQIQFADGNLFWDINSSARVGLEYARFMTTYNDGHSANNDRVQLSTFFIF